MGTLADTIREITRSHLEQKKGRLYAQCVKAVGWIGGTVPDVDGIVELPTSDSSNGAIVVGAALGGERPIYVIRYQGFLTYNLSTIANYAAKSLEMWNEPCPVLVRALSMEGSMGPVASNSHHSSVIRFPGIKVYCPITPKEWESAYHDFMNDSGPYFFSESRLALTNENEFPDVVIKNPKLTLFLVGPIRLKHEELKREFPECNIVNVFLLKPFLDKSKCLSIFDGDYGVVVDSDYTICGAAEHIAYELMISSGKKVYALGLDDRTAGFSKQKDNLTPTLEKINEVINSCSGN